MIVYTAASSSDRDRARLALDAVKESADLVVAFDWLAEIEARPEKNANHGIDPEEAAAIANAGLSHVLRASTLWLLVPTLPSIGFGVELGTFNLARGVPERFKAPRRIIASGGRRDVSVFVGLADEYFWSDVDALGRIEEIAREDRERVAKIVNPG